MRIRALLREPLLHFAVLGGLIFAANAWFGEGAPEGSAVVVDQAWVSGVEAGLGRGLGRAPTTAELAEALSAAVDDELLFREGLALGLDRGDPIVRRRLIQKTRFLHEDRAELEGVSDEELAAYLAEHHERYVGAARVGLSHAFAATDRHDDPEAKAAELLAEIRAGGALEGLGDPFPHGQRIGLRTPADLEALFGQGFAAGLGDVAVGETALLRSSYGWHVVRVDEREAASLPPLSLIRARVERDRAEELRERAAEAGLRRLREGAQIVLEVEDEGLRAALKEAL